MRILLAVALAFLLTGCGSSAPHGAASLPSAQPMPALRPAQAAEVIGHTYTTTRYRAGGRWHRVASDRAITVQFLPSTPGSDGPSANIGTGCNSVGGAFRLAHGDLRLIRPMMTTMGCLGTLGTQDHTIAGLVSHPMRAAFSGKTLVLTGGGVELRLTPH